jgi:hypothetical protein
MTIQDRHRGLESPGLAASVGAGSHIDPRLVGAACLTAVLGAAILAVAGPQAAGFLLGALLGAEVLLLVAWRPVIATYAYLATLPLIAGIGRGNLIPLVRPNEALLAFVLLGALLGAYVRYLRGGNAVIRPHPIDAPLLTLVLLSTIWPIASLMLRGAIPEAADFAAVLPIPKLVGLFLLVRFTIQTEEQVLRCARLIIWSGTLLATIAILQTLRFPPVVMLLETLWAPNEDAEKLVARGSATLGSPIAAGDYVIICLVLLICLTNLGMVRRVEAYTLGAVLGTGIPAVGQFTTWICALVAAALVLHLFPDLRRRALRFLPILPVVLLVGAPALVARLEGFKEFGIPVSWIGRWDNLTHFFLPRFDLFHILVGVSPNPVLEAPETWRNVVYLEGGYLYFLWIGGVPLLITFFWLSARALVHLRQVRPRPDSTGACASTLYIVWILLLVVTVLDPHLQLRGTGDLIFALLAITIGRSDE